MSSSIPFDRSRSYALGAACPGLLLGTLLVTLVGCTTYDDLEPSSLGPTSLDLVDASDPNAGPEDGPVDGGVDRSADALVFDAASDSNGAGGDGPNDHVDRIADAGPPDAATDSSGAGDGLVSDVVDARTDARPAEAGPSCTDVSTGLVGHWTMDSSSIVGSQLLDVSPNHRDGTLMGFSGTAVASGKLSQALSYPSGGTAYALIPTLGLDQATGSMNSVSLWFYRDATNLDDVLVSLPDSPRYDLWLTKKTRTSLCINTARADCFGIQDDGLTGRWVHVVAVFANGPETGGRLYVDGVDRNASCVTDTGFGACTYSATASQPVTFGGPTSFYFHGLLDEVRIYRRALTGPEVSALYSGAACP
jgi:hypothetical protein